MKGWTDLAQRRDQKTSPNPRHDACWRCKASCHVGNARLVVDFESKLGVLTYVHTVGVCTTSSGVCSLLVIVRCAQTAPRQKRFEFDTFQRAEGAGHFSESLIRHLPAHARPFRSEDKLLRLFIRVKKIKKERKPRSISFSGMQHGLATYYCHCYMLLADAICRKIGLVNRRERAHQTELAWRPRHT